jgi:hypothetical protein
MPFLPDGGDLLHPCRSVVFGWPSEQAAWEILLWDVPLRVISVLSQPNVNLLGSPLVVDLSDDEWPLTRKEILAPAENLVLSAFDVNLDQLWNGAAPSNEVVDRSCRYTYDLSVPYDGMLPVGFHAAL